MFHLEVFRTPFYRLELDGKAKSGCGRSAPARPIDRSVEVRQRPGSAGRDSTGAVDSSRRGRKRRRAVGQAPRLEQTAWTVSAWGAGPVFLTLADQAPPVLVPEVPVATELLMSQEEPASVARPPPVTAVPAGHRTPAVASSPGWTAAERVTGRMPTPGIAPASATPDPRGASLVQPVPNERVPDERAPGLLNAAAAAPAPGRRAGTGGAGRWRRRACRPPMRAPRRPVAGLRRPAGSAGRRPG